MSSMKGDRERCLEAGMDEYVSKPVQSKLLFDTIERVVHETGNHGSGAPQDLEGDEVLAALRNIEPDPEFMREVASLFLDEYPKLLADLDISLSREDSLGLSSAAHTLKGAVANFGARRAVAAAERLESLGRMGDLTGAGEAISILRRELDLIRPSFVRIVDCCSDLIS